MALRYSSGICSDNHHWFHACVKRFMLSMSKVFNVSIPRLSWPGALPAVFFLMASATSSTLKLSVFKPRSISSIFGLCLAGGIGADNHWTWCKKSAIFSARSLNPTCCHDGPST